MENDQPFCTNSPRPFAYARSGALNSCNYERACLGKIVSTTRNWPVPWPHLSRIGDRLSQLGSLDRCVTVFGSAGFGESHRGYPTARERGR